MNSASFHPTNKWRNGKIMELGALVGLTLPNTYLWTETNIQNVLTTYNFLLPTQILKLLRTQEFRHIRKVLDQNIFSSARRALLC